MMHPRDFAAARFPTVPEAAILCVGLHLGGDEGWPDAVAPFVTAGERDRAARFVHAADAIRHLVGRALVRRVLHREGESAAPIAFSLSPWGKPLHREIEFSIAHSGEMVWAGFCRRAALGIDVESIRPLTDLADLTAQLHPEEGRAIRALPPGERDAAFYRCWTRKEAVLKATGKGLSLPLDGFCVETGPHDRDWIVAPPEDAPAAGAWTTRDIACGPDHRCCVAAQAPYLELAIFAP